MPYGIRMSQIKPIDVLRAIYKGKVDLLIQYADIGINFHEVTEVKQWNYLHRATPSVSPTMKINIPSLKFLIGQGLDVDGKDCYGNTPLQYAARVKNVDAINILIDAGANINTLNNEMITPLQHAFHSKPFIYEAVEALLLNGADPDHHLPSSESSIRLFVCEICNDQDRAIKELFEQIQALK